MSEDAPAVKKIKIEDVVGARTASANENTVGNMAKKRKVWSLSPPETNTLWWLNNIQFYKPVAQFIPMFLALVFQSLIRVRNTGAYALAAESGWEVHLDVWKL